jgi:hypothetical protein
MDVLIKDEDSLLLFQTDDTSYVTPGNFSHHHVQTGSGAHSGSYPVGVKQPGREPDHSPPPGAKVKNAWSYTSTSPIRLHGVVLS